MKLFILASLISINAFCQDSIITPQSPIEFTAKTSSRIGLGVEWEMKYIPLPNPVTVRFDGDTLTILYNGSLYLEKAIINYRYRVLKEKKYYVLETLSNDFTIYILIEIEKLNDEFVYGIMIPHLQYKTGRFLSYKLFR